MRNWVKIATPELVYDVSLNMRERDLKEILAVCWESDRESLAKGLAGRYGTAPMCVVFGRDESPICVLSAVCAHPGVWSIGLWATDQFDVIGRYVTRWALRYFFPALKLSGLHRLECKSIIGYDEVHEWLRFLGMHEGNVEKMYGKNGEDFVTFYWHEGAPIGKRLGLFR